MKAASDRIESEDKRERGRERDSGGERERERHEEGLHGSQMKCPMGVLGPFERGASGHARRKKATRSNTPTYAQLIYICSPSDTLTPPHTYAEPPYQLGNFACFGHYAEFV